MASSSGRSVICLLHTGGHFVNGEDGYPQYVGGSIISRTIKEGMTYEELKTIVVTIVGGGAEIGDISMKFRLSGDETTTYVDLLDDEGVEHFMNLTREMGHIFVSGCPIEDTQLTRDVRRNVQNE